MIPLSLDHRDSTTPAITTIESEAMTRPPVKQTGGIPYLNRTTYYINENWVRMEYTNGTSEDTLYVYGNNELLARKDASGDKYYYHPDHLGSTVVVSREDAGLEERISYEPYGLPRQSSDELYQFTSQEWQGDLGFYDYGARQYNPTIKRFMQADYVIPDYYNPQALNRYSYTLNNPLKYTDPDGYAWQVVAAVIVGGGIGLYALNSLTSYFGVPIGTALLFNYKSLRRGAALTKSECNAIHNDLASTPDNPPNDVNILNPFVVADWVAYGLSAIFGNPLKPINYCNYCRTSPEPQEPAQETDTQAQHQPQHQDTGGDLPTKKQKETSQIINSRAYTNRYENGWTPSREYLGYKQRSVVNVKNRRTESSRAGSTLKHQTHTRSNGRTYGKRVYSH